MNVLIEFDRDYEISLSGDKIDIYKIYYNHVLIARFHFASNSKDYNSVLKFEEGCITAIALATINIKLFEYFGVDIKFKVTS